MTTQRLGSLVWIMFVVCLMAVGATGARAQDGAPPTEDAVSRLGTAATDAALIGVVPVQGYLTDSEGTPLSGSVDITFSLYDAQVGGTPLCTDDDLVGVSEGHFYGEMDWCTSDDIDGRQLYLGIQVEDDPEMAPRQAIYAVPYAWSLRAGAMISGSLNSNAILDIRNYGDGGRGLRSYAMAETGANYGVVGASRSPDGYGGFFYNNGEGVGLYASGSGSSADIILGGTADTATGDNGVIASQQSYPSSDIVIRTNDTLRIDLDDDGSGEDADFEIYNKDDQRIFDVDESGAMTYGGTGIAAFPRPAYDSGWVAISRGSGNALTLNHNLGGNVDNYIVELTFKETGGYGTHTFGFGADVTSGAFYGAWWRNLTTSAIVVERATNDEDISQVRVRIWMYN